MDTSQTLLVLMAVPLSASLLMALIPSRRASIRVFESIHVLSITLVLALGGMLVASVVVTGETVSAVGLWFRLDPLGSIFVALIVVIGFMTGIFSLPYIRHDIETGVVDSPKVKQYYLFFNLFVFTMLLVSLSNNIIVMWVAIEATTLSTVFLVGLYNTKTALEAAWKYVTVCASGVAFGLYGTLLVYADAANVMADPNQAAFLSEIIPYASQLDPKIIMIAFVFIAIGFGTKAGLFPMHTWLPDAHSEAPSPISGLLSGVLLKCAILVIIRFYTLSISVVGPTFPQTVMLILGAASVIFAAFAVFVQDDIKRKLAYSSCENVGVIALALGFGGPIGIAAALLHCIMHALTKSYMFCLSGNIVMKYGTRDLGKIKGVIKTAPATAVLLTIGFLALSGFPPFAMFVSEVMLFLAGVATGDIWLVIVIALALTVVIAAFTLVVIRSVLGDAPEGMKRGDVPLAALVPEFLLVAVIIWFGIALPAPVVAGVESATRQVVQASGIDSDQTLLSGSLFAGLQSSIMDE